MTFKLTKMSYLSHECCLGPTSCMNKINNCVFTLCLRIYRQNNALALQINACPMHSPFGFVNLTHQNLSARALFCLNSLAKVNTQLLIYE